VLYDSTTGSSGIGRRFVVGNPIHVGYDRIFRIIRKLQDDQVSVEVIVSCYDKLGGKDMKGVEFGTDTTRWDTAWSSARATRPRIAYRAQVLIDSVDDQYLARFTGDVLARGRRD